MTAAVLELLCFRVRDRAFAVDIMAITEILRNRTITPVPQAPAFVAGVLNLRGELIPVVDLQRALLGSVKREMPESKVIVTRSGGLRAALLVDVVLDVVSVAVEELLPVPGTVPGQGTSVVAAFRRDLEGVDDPVVLLLRLGSLLRQEATVHEGDGQ